MRLARWPALWPLLLASVAMADVYQWQWVDPNDPSQGKMQSSMLCRDGTGQTPGPRSSLGGDLTKAYLYSLDLSYSSWFGTTLNDAYFGRANLYQMLLYNCSLRNADFTGVQGMGHFRFCDLTGADFTDAKLKHFSFSTLDNANFTRADLSNASFEQGTLRAANFTDAIITGTQFIGVQELTQEQLHQTGSYKGKNLRGVSFTGRMDLSGWDLSGGLDLTLASFSVANLAGARFNAATLTSAGFQGADLTSADFSGASMSTAWLGAADLTNANFTGADLSNAYARASAWSNANLTGAIITGADLSANGTADLTAQQLYSTASYRAHDLRGAKLEDLNMTGWSFRGVDLSNADLRAAKLVGADFTDANLNRVVLDESNLQNADFASVDLSTTSLGLSDLRGARNVVLNNTSNSGIILPDGTFDGFPSGFSILWIRNYTGPNPIPVHLTQDVHRPARIEIDLDANPWESTITFEPGIAVDVGGTSLVVQFDDAVNPALFIGDTFQIFDWTGVTPTGHFDLFMYQDEHWDISKLYTDGTVTLMSVPEPSELWVLLAMLAGGMVAGRTRSGLFRSPYRW